ncbi:MAG: hypothetical protein RL112_2614 [Planctomycetota bacterium]
MVREQHEPESVRAAEAVPPRRRASLAAPLASIAAALLLACAPDRTDDEAPPAPPGAVLMLDDEPLDEATIDAVAGVWARLDPVASLPHLRQLALTNTMFPLAGARLVDRAGRADALVAIERARAAVLAGAPAGELALLSVEERELAGDWQKLTPILWNWALDAEVGDLSPVMEQPGVWCFARLVSRGDAANPRDFACSLRVYHRGWLPSDSAQRGIEERFARSTLRFVDPSWRDVVPLHWQKKLNAR